MGQLRSYTWKGTTLLETLVALIIILISFTIGVTAFVKVTDSSASRRTVQAYWYMEKYLDHWETQPEGPRVVSLQNGFTLHSEIMPYAGHDRLVMVKVTVTDAGENELGTRKRLFLKPDAL